MGWEYHNSAFSLSRLRLFSLLLIASAITGLAETRYESIDEAIARGDLEDVQAHLHADPATANQGKHPRMTPLQMAVLRNKSEIAAVLVEAGADVDIKDNSQRTPLHFAVERKSLPIVLLLLKHKAQPNERDKVGWTPLHHAAAKDSVEIATALLDGGADLEKLSDGGGTALHEAAASGGAAMIKLLLKRGVDPTVVSKTGVTAADIARERKNQPALAALNP